MKKLGFFLLVFVPGFVCHAQTYDGSLNSLVAVNGKYAADHQPEKLYLQMDRANYDIGDTLWFKGYLFNAGTMRASNKSAIVYIEISNELNVLMMRREIIVNNGTASGYIPFDKIKMPEGAYTIRAYTQWMRNFDANYVFEGHFNITDLDKYDWLINYSADAKNGNTDLHLQLKQLDKSAVSSQAVQLNVKQGGGVLVYDKDAVTSPSGELDLKLSPHNNNSPVIAKIQKMKGEKPDGSPAYVFPVFINRPEKTDLQFMPESGYLVAGVNTAVGFKAIGEDGNGTAISGIIVNNRNEQVASFRSLHKGMGSFTFKPEAGMTYKAIADLPNGEKKEYAFPAVKPAGTVLTVDNNSSNDSVLVRISGVNAGGTFILLGQSRGLICYAAKVKLNNSTQELKAPKSAFANGVAKFSLLNGQLATLNERLVYIDRHDELHINVIPDRPSYALQDSIALHIEVKDANGRPVRGTFSMSVTDDLQLSGRDSSNMLTELLLTSDLKGNIEDPLYYFEPGHQKALDDLLLTQGWTNFDWTALFVPKPMAFKPETSLELGGKVTSILGKAKGVKVNLFSLKPFISTDTLTDVQGNFVFKDMPLIDSVAYYLHATTSSSGNGTYAIDLDRPEWPIFPANRPQLPWYVNTTPSALKKADTLIAIQQQIQNGEFKTTGKLLKDVTITDKKIIKGSHNLNGPGNADQILDEKDIAKAGKATLLDLLKQQVKDFRVIEYPRKDPHGDIRATFSILSDRIGGFIFDGVMPKFMPFSMYHLLTSYSADEIVGIEVMYKTFSPAYETKFLGRPPLFPVPFIEITTREGMGPIYRVKHPSFVLYMPPSWVQDKQFYRPRYTVKNAAVAATDHRTTIHWEPNIITDKNGQALVTFYAAGQPSTYTITTEGSDMNGGIGSSTQKLSIKKPSP